jgi:hypothetical protein
VVTTMITTAVCSLAKFRVPEHVFPFATQTTIASEPAEKPSEMLESTEKEGRKAEHLWSGIVGVKPEELYLVGRSQGP